MPGEGVEPGEGAEPWARAEEARVLHLLLERGSPLWMELREAGSLPPCSLLCPCSLARGLCPGWGFDSEETNECLCVCQS